MAKKKSKKSMRKTAEVRKPETNLNASTVEESVKKAQTAGTEAKGKTASGPPPSKVEWSRLAFPLILMAISLVILMRGALVGRSEPKQASAGAGMPASVTLPDKGFQTLSPAVWFAALKKAGPANTVILDVRTPGELSAGRIHPEGYEFLNLDYYDGTFEQELNRLDKKKTYFVYCSSGFRSGITIERMKSLGFERVFNLSGGLAEYRRAGLPLNTER